MTTDAISVDDFREKAQAWLAEHKGEAPRDYGAILPPDLADQGRAGQRLILAGGFAGIPWPTEYGGLGLPPAHPAAWTPECRRDARRVGKSGVTTGRSRWSPEL